MYVYDYDFVNAAMQLSDATSPSKLVYDSTNASSIIPAINQISAMVSGFKQKWAIRVEAIENIAQN
jgi:hypothetical protein